MLFTVGNVIKGTYYLASSQTADILGERIGKGNEEWWRGEGEKGRGMKNVVGRGEGSTGGGGGGEGKHPVPGNVFVRLTL